ncbi:MAG TPA: hypothetical protein VEZ40_06960, partial [Pyrinomonadaceae bacterium]|nr:hypothetical protein [Pyrinomonadaceae bacterium]
MLRRNQQKTLVVGVLAALLGFGLVAFLMSRGDNANNPPAAATQTQETAADSPAQSSTQGAPDAAAPT